MIEVVTSSSDCRRRATSDSRERRVILAVRKMGVLQREIEKGVQILQKGGVIAFPTDTVYGLGADAFNTRAVERVYEIKNRPRASAIPLAYR